MPSLSLSPLTALVGRRPPLAAFALSPLSCPLSLVAHRSRGRRSPLFAFSLSPSLAHSLSPTTALCIMHGCVAHRSHHRPLLSRVHRPISGDDLSLSLTSLTAHRTFPLLPLSPMLPTSHSPTALSLSRNLSH
ncbi:hypothetical protein Syun_006371 [Stephania yunnanensis]|uniref:Uncharacterized protein n=1 Tax=Stephania yunnanensis TaxID=152371 RepID=A0AAP0PYG5_9MAGN